MKKNNFIPILISLFIFVGCVNDLPTTSLDEIEQGSTYLSLRSSVITVPGDATSVESITINSLRILVFSKNTGLITTNEVFDVSGIQATKQSDDSWIIDLSTIVVPTNPGLSVVYAVLNEDVSSIGSLSLTSALNAISNLTEMQSLIDTPLNFSGPIAVTYKSDGVTPNEPPFIMTAFDEFDILPNRPINNPYIADLRGENDSIKGFAMDRTMAKITLDSLSNTDLSGNPLIESLQEETSFIFILEMGLRKVTKQYLWSPNRNISNEIPVPPYNTSIGYHDLTFPLPDPNFVYYDRNWSGDISFNIDANAYKVESKDARIWYTGNGSGSNAYSLSKTALDDYIQSQNNFNTNKAFYDSFNGGTPTILTLNSGNWQDYVQTAFTDTLMPFLPTYYELIQPYTLTPIVTGGTWSLKSKNISYYVPENILSDIDDPTNSTKFYVKAVVANAPTTITQQESQNIDWTEESWGPWQYSVTPGGTLDPAAINSLWGFERDTIVHKGTSYPIIRHYWSTGIRYANGRAKGSVDGIGFKNSNISSSTNIKTFELPIRNNVAEGESEDYNVYRNNEYKFSIHVMKQWENILGSGAPNSQAKTRNAWGVTDNSMILRIHK